MTNDEIRRNDESPMTKRAGHAGSGLGVGWACAGAEEVAAPATRRKAGDFSLIGSSFGWSAYVWLAPGNPFDRIESDLLGCTRIGSDQAGWGHGLFVTLEFFQA